MLCCRCSSDDPSNGGSIKRKNVDFSTLAKKLQTTKHQKEKKFESPNEENDKISFASRFANILPTGKDDDQSGNETNSCLPPSLGDLPDELLLTIFGYIHPLEKSFAKLKGVCRHFRDILNTDCLYQTTLIDISQDRPFDFDLFTLTLARSTSSLKVVNLSHSFDVSDYVVYQIASKCRSITDVDLSHCAQITDVGLRVLANLVDLRRIDISGCPKITSRGVHLMVKLNGVSLEEVAMKNCIGLRRDLKGPLHLSKYCRKLKRLDIGWDEYLSRINPLSCTDINRFTRNMTYLLFLDISGSSCSDNSLEAVVQNCQKLETLKLRHCPIGDIALRHIGMFLPNLAHLDLAGCSDITDVGLESLDNGCRLLRHIDVSQCFNIVGDGLFSLVSHCKDMTTVVARDCYDLSEDSIVFIAVLCEHLKYFDVSFNHNVTDETVTSITSDQDADNELTLVTNGCPNVTSVTGSKDSVGINPTEIRQRRFRFIDWKGRKGAENETFVIWETAV